MKIFIGKLALLNASGFGISTVSKTRVRGLCIIIPKVTKHETTVEEDAAKDFSDSSFRVSGG